MTFKINSGLWNFLVKNTRKVLCKGDSIYAVEPGRFVAWERNGNRYMRLI